MMCNYIHHKVWDEITYQFPNVNGATVEVRDSIINFIPQFTGHVITYPCWDWGYSMLIKGTQAIVLFFILLTSVAPFTNMV